MVEVAGCWREWGEGSSVVGRLGAGARFRTVVGAGDGAGVGVGVGETGATGAAVWVTALLWTSLPSPLVI